MLVQLVWYMQLDGLARVMQTQNTYTWLTWQASVNFWRVLASAVTGLTLGISL